MPKQLNLTAARKLILILDDCLDGKPAQNRKVLERLRRDYPELIWDCIQDNPPLFGVTHR